MKKRLLAFIIITIIISCLYKLLLYYLIKQAKQPKGFIGKKMTSIWSTYFTNLNQWTLNKIKIDNHTILLIVGFGGGSSISYIKEHYPYLRLYGIDISKESLKTTTKRNQLYMNQNLFLSISDVANQEYSDDFFDIIIAEQTHIYWSKMVRGLRECYRVLKSGGTFLVSCEIDKIRYHLPDYQDHRSFIDLLYTIGFDYVTMVTENNYIAFIATK